MKRVFAFIGFSSAITLILLNILSFSFAKYILISAVLLFFISLLIKKTRQALVVPIVLGSILFACPVFIFVNINTVIPQQSLDGEYVNASFQIIDIPKEKENGYSYIVKTKSINRDNTVQNIKMKVSSDVEIAADYYDIVTADLSIYKISDSPMNSYGYYGDGVFLTSHADNISVEKTTTKPPNFYILKCREFVKETLQNMLPDDNASLASALLIGDKDGLSDEIRNQFNSAGAAHIMAVSGLHTTVICYGFYLLLKRFGFSPYLRTGLTFGVIIFYIAMADFSKSVIRSGIMLAVMLLAKLINKKADTLNSLGFAVFIMCLNPFAVSDSGAMLTVTSLLGILLINPVFNKYCPENRILRYLYKSVAVSFSVALSTLPVMWLFFKKITLTGVLINFAIIPLAQLTMILAMLLVITSGIPFLSFIPKHLCVFCTDAMFKIIDYSSSKFNVLSKSIFGELFGIAIAMILLLCGISLIITKGIHTKIVAAFSIVFFAAACCMNVYVTSITTFVHIENDGAIIIYNNDYIVAVDSNSNSNYFYLKNILGRNDFENIIFIDCDSNITQLCNSDVKIDSLSSNSNFSVDLSDDIIVKCNGSDIIVKIYDWYVTINDDFLSVGDYKAFRNVKSKFNDNSDILISFVYNSQVFVRKESVWLN